jgi:hypothetical protein
MSNKPFVIWTFQKNPKQILEFALGKDKVIRLKNTQEL